MTAVVALDLANPKDQFMATDDAAQVAPTRIWVVRGQRLNLEELLHALLFTSANDAAEMIRQGINQLRFRL